MTLLIVLLVLPLGADSVWEFMQELRATRTYVNGEMEYEVSWPSASGNKTQVGDYRFFGDDAIHSMREARPDVAHRVPIGIPYNRRARIGQYQISNNGHALSSAISDNGYDFDDPIPAVGQAGLYPNPSAIDQGDQQYLTDLVGETGDATIRRQSDGNLAMIHVRVSDARELVIWQDPARGDQVVRSQIRDDDVVTYECRVDLSRIGRRWFPEKVEYYRIEGGALQLNMVYRMSNVTLDDPEMAPLTLADAGIDVGTNIRRISGSGDEAEQQRLLSWDGDGVVPMRDVHQRIMAGELERGPLFERDLAMINLANEMGITESLVNPETAIGTNVSRWRAYTLSFIRHYGLDESQRQKALLICGECEKKATRVIERSASLIADLEHMGADVVATGGGNEQLKRDYIRERKELLAKIEIIFEKDLKSRLEKLPTRQQRPQAKEQTDDP